MKAAFFSDVHGNLEALQAFLKDTDDCDSRYFCGDAVGYGDRPNEVCEAIRQESTTAVVGNHDYFVLGKLDFDHGKDHLYRTTWTKNCLSESNKKWLQSLPEKIDLDVDGFQIEICHASPWDMTTYLYRDSPNLFKAMPRDGASLVVGHTHHAFLHSTSTGTIVNCGSVGFPRSGMAGANYFIFDSQNGIWSHKIATYNSSELQKRLQSNGWDEAIIKKIKDPSSKHITIS